MDDKELYDLFSSFDEMSAPESAKAAALDNILALAAQQGAAQAGASQAGAQPESAAQGGVTASAAKPALKAKRGGKTRWNAIRAAAVAACFTLALTGGAAYAVTSIPVSHVTITQGDATIELPVNILGQTLSGTGNDAGRLILDGVEYRNMSLEDSVKAVSDTMRKSNPSTPISVTRDGQTALDASGKPLAPAPEALDEHDGVKQIEQHAGNDAGALPGAAGAVVPSTPSEHSDADYPAVVIPSTGIVGGTGSQDSGSTSSDTPTAISEPKPSSEEPVVVPTPEPDPVPDPDPTPVPDPEPSPIDDPVDDPVDDPIDDPVVDPIDDPVDDPVVDPIDDMGGDSGDDGGTRPPSYYSMQSSSVEADQVDSASSEL